MRRKWSTDEEEIFSRFYAEGGVEAVQRALIAAGHPLRSRVSILSKAQKRKITRLISCRICGTRFHPVGHSLTCSKTCSDEASRRRWRAQKARAKQARNHPCRINRRNWIPEKDPEVVRMVEAAKKGLLDLETMTIRTYR